MRKSRIILLKLVLPAILQLALFLNIKAQGVPSCSSVGIDFELVESVGCADFTVTVQLAPNSAAIDDAVFDYDNALNGTFIDTSNYSYTNTYNTPGIYNIIVYPEITGSSGRCYDTLKVTVLEKKPPIFDILPCQGYGVRVVIKDNIYDSYLINYGIGIVTFNAPNTRPAPAPPFTGYTGPGTPQINVQGLYNPGNCGGNSNNDEMLIDVLEAPLIDSLQISDFSTDSIRLNFLADPRFTYRVYRSKNGGSFTPTAPLPINSLRSEYMDKDALGTATTRYCYYLEVEDACGNTNVSETICSIMAFDAQAQDSRNRITWSSYTDASRFIRYELYRSDVSGPYKTFTAQSINSFFDSAVTCGVSYCYRLRTVLDDSAVSVTNQKCVTSFSTSRPPAVDTVFSTYNEANQVEIYYSMPDETNISSIFLYSSPNDSVRIDGSGVYIDNSPANNRRCYNIALFDSCDNKGALGTRTCPIFLTVSKSSFSRYNLRWTPFVEFRGGVGEYIVEKLDRFGQVYFSFPVGPATLAYTDDFSASDPDGIDKQSQVIRYRVRAEPLDPSEIQTMSNYVDVRQDNRIRIPTAFTPDGDGLNDELEIRSVFIKDYRMLIYNRWGELVFESKNPNDFWDGRYNGNYVPSGVYGYVFDGIDYTGEEIKEKGTITVFSKN